MTITLDQKTRIIGTGYGWALQKKRNFKGGDRWESYRWFSTFRHALEDAVHSEIRTHPATSVSEAIDAVSAIVQRYEQLIPSEYRISK